MTRQEFRKDEINFYRALRRHRDMIETPGSAALTRYEIDAARAWCVDQEATSARGREQYREVYDQAYERWHGYRNSTSPVPSSPKAWLYSLGCWLLVGLCFVFGMALGRHL